MKGILVLTHLCLFICILRDKYKYSQYYRYDCFPCNSNSIIIIILVTLSSKVCKVVFYIPSLPNNRIVKLFAIYSVLHISLHNIFVKKEKYHE